jgi:hypothetical protein
MNHAPDRLRVIDQLGQIEEASELFVPLNIAPLLLNINESYKKKLKNIVGQLNHDHS